jgi:hypothetical protein
VVAESHSYLHFIKSVSFSLIIVVLIAIHEFLLLVYSRVIAKTIMNRPLLSKIGHPCIGCLYYNLLALTGKLKYILSNISIP